VPVVELDMLITFVNRADRLREAATRLRGREDPPAHVGDPPESGRT